MLYMKSIYSLNLGSHEPVGYCFFPTKQIVPGVGDFSRRYFEAKRTVEENAAKSLHAANKKSSGGWWRPWKRAG